MAKRKERKLCDSSEKTAGSIKQDRISVLPDELLVHILSCITLRQAVSTSLISKRWRHLWKGIPCLRFDAANIFDQKLSREEEQLRTPEFVNRVDRLVSQMAEMIPVSHRISSLLVGYEIAEEAVSHIDQWVSFAIEHGVSELVMVVKKTGTVSWSFPPKLASDEKLCCMRKLHLTGAITVATFVGFKNLNDVYLVSVMVANEAFEDLISNCSFLVKLVVHSAKKLTSIKLPETLVRLRCLHISHCKSLLKVEVNAANLILLSYIGSVTEFCFNNVSKLERLFLGRMDAVASQLLSKNLKLQDLILFLDLYSKNCDIDFKKLPTLTNLKSLSLSVVHLSSGVVGVVNFLKATPSLVEFGLHLKDPDFVTPELGKTLTKTFRHKCLREIVLSGFSGGQGHIELACSLIESTASLKKLTISPYQCYHKRPTSVNNTLREEPDLERLAAVRSCIGLISRKLPPTAKLELVE